MSKITSKTNKKSNKTKDNGKIKKIFVVCLSFILIIAACVIGFFMLNSKKSEGITNKYSLMPTINNVAYTTTNSKVGYYAEILGETKRTIPETLSENLCERYPVYGMELSDATDEEKNNILTENKNLLCAYTKIGSRVISNATYDSMDSDGNLYLNGEDTGRNLYKHIASEGMYYGDVSDTETAIIKKITIKSRTASNYITGLYAPAGEVITIQMSDEDLQKTGGLYIHIGQVLANSATNNIWAAKNFNRMPIIANTMKASKTTDYVGSFLGGPIYVEPVNALASGESFSFTISGGVTYSHYIYGYTTEEEFEKNASSTAPYFDLEIWDRGVRHSGSNSYVSEFSYEDLTNAAILWDKICSVSTQVPTGSNSAVGIHFLYDPFVAAGAAVAFVGGSTVNAPSSWITASLDYNSFISSGAWGSIHEYNHHFQKYGFAPGDEVTNNAVSLVSYSLFTKISSSRNIELSEEGLSGWNRYTNASWVLKQTLANSGANSNLDSYANILYSFGQDVYLQATQNGGGLGGVDVWFKALCDATHYDMTYYFVEILHQTVSESVLKEVSKLDYPMYVPVASIYQTGVGIKYKDGTSYSTTMKPYEITYGTPYQFDLANSIVLPSGFKFTIQNITLPQHGTLTKISDGVYSYVFDDNYETSGEICVTLSITKNDKSFAVNNVDLILEFKKDSCLDRVTYLYSSENMYQSATEAYQNGYDNFDTKIEQANTNINTNGAKIQNGNAEIWVPNYTSNAIMEISGKIPITSDGNYRIALRGRWNACLYVSFDDENYELAATITSNSNNTANFVLDDPTHYKDFENLKAGQFIYFKATLIVTSYSSFVGVGIGKFVGENVTVNYANAYRNNCEYQEFQADYRYGRDYTQNYNKECDAEQTLLGYKYNAWDSSYSIDNLFDGNGNTFIHSAKGEDISEKNPFEIVVDFGKVITANNFTIYGVSNKRYLPTTFVLYLGDDLENLKPILSIKNYSVTSTDISFSFEITSFRYYKLVVTDTSATSQINRYIAFKSIGFSIYANGCQLSPFNDNSNFKVDGNNFENFVYTFGGDWSKKIELSTFGNIYVSENGSVEFEFTGNLFAIYAYKSLDYGQLKIYIDDVLATSVSLCLDINSVENVYTSNILSSGNHIVKIEGINKINLDSIVLFDVI